MKTILKLYEKYMKIILKIYDEYMQGQARAQKLAQGRPGTRARANFWARAWAQAHFLGPGLHFHDFHIIFTLFSHFFHIFCHIIFTFFSHFEDFMKTTLMVGLIFYNPNSVYTGGVLAACLRY